MIEGWSLDTGLPTHAECCRVRERAQRILAEAQRLRDRLDQTDGLLSFTLQAQTGITELTPLAASATARMQSSLFAA